MPSLVDNFTGFSRYEKFMQTADDLGHRLMVDCTLVRERYDTLSGALKGLNDATTRLEKKKTEKRYSKLQEWLDYAQAVLEV